MFFLPKVHSCKLYNKYIIASLQITNTEIFVFTTVLVFKLFRQTRLLFKKIENCMVKLLQNYK